VVGSEHVPCLLGGALQNDYHESTHQECAIDHLVSLVGGTIVKDTIVGVVLVAEQPSQLARIPMDHCQVQGTEIFVEREVRQIIVDIEEECILVILRWLCARYPIQFVFYDFDWSSDNLVTVYLLLHRRCVNVFISFAW